MWIFHDRQELWTMKEVGDEFCEIDPFNWPWVCSMLSQSQVTEWIFESFNKPISQYTCWTILSMYTYSYTWSNVISSHEPTPSPRDAHSDFKPGSGIPSMAPAHLWLPLAELDWQVAPFSAKATFIRPQLSLSSERKNELSNGCKTLRQVVLWLFYFII